MSDSHWRLLARLADEGVSPSNLPANIESVIAERLEEALGAPSRAELDALKLDLADFFAVLLRRAPADAAAAVRGAADASEAGVAAFWLGQIAFAQHAAAQAADRRADDRFAPVFANPTLTPYIRVLAQKDYTGRELAAALDLREETVSRRLTELRELGVVDYRRDGTSFYNFLTPQARAAFEGLVAPEALPHRDPVKVRMVRDRQQKVSEPFQEWPTLSSPAALLGH
jgi:DNA-binding transcriptional ArsR family regulator